MNNNKNNQVNGRQQTRFPMAQVIPPSQLEEILNYAKDPQTLEDKLKLFDRYCVDYEVVNTHTGFKSRRSKLGTFINDLFKTKLLLPIGQRRYQIAMAIKFARFYLIENPDVSIYFATAMGAADEYREWMASVGDLKPEQQMAILASDEVK
jgi:hypothetical protein